MNNGNNEPHNIPTVEEIEALIWQHTLENKGKYYTKKKGTLKAPAKMGCLKQHIEAFYSSIDELRENGMIL